VPYIVTTSYRSAHTSAFDRVRSRHAVATLEEARDYVWAKFGWPSLAGVREAIREDGVPVGPMPDGTVVEAERVDWIVLAKTLGAHWWHMARAAELSDQKAAASLIAAYNAAQETTR
jgi:hypothetical protein